MNQCFRSRPVLFKTVFFAVLLIFAVSIQAQTSGEKTAGKPKRKASSENKFLVHILEDQRAIWTSPFHLKGTDARWLAPLGLSTIALVATDRHTSGELVEHGDNPDRLRISNDVSKLGSFYVTGGVAGSLYLIGRATDNDRLRETGLLGGEALINSEIVVRALKTASQRQRPPEDDSSGEFFDGGSSFPSGHAVSSWALATVVAQEYGQHRPLVQLGVYGLATAVSISRYTGRKHFLSDVLVGGAMGYGIGRYVFHKRHNQELDFHTKKQPHAVLQSNFFPRILPLYNPRARVYGAMLSWNF
jgi:hypothetical protein